MSTGSMEFSQEQIMEAHNSVVKACKSNKEFAEKYLKEGVDFNVEDVKILPFNEQLAMIYNPNGEGGVHYPPELVFHPLVIGNLMYTSSEYDSNEGYTDVIYMEVNNKDLDFHLFAPDGTGKGYKWSKPLELKGNWFKLIEDMYVSSGVDLPLSEYENAVIKISMIDGELRLTFYTGLLRWHNPVSFHYHQINSKLIRKMLAMLPIEAGKVSEVYIIYADWAEDSLNKYISRKDKNGEYVLTLF